jgi:hypothetical protein
MSVRKQDEAKTKRAQKRAFHRDLANRNLERQIGSSFVLGIRPEIEGLLHWCVLEKPADIKSVAFHNLAISLEIDWPFRLPDRTNDSGTYFPTARSVKQFAEDFRIYLLEQKCGAKLANLLRNEFEAFLPKFFRAQRFEIFSVGRESTDTVRDVLAQISEEMRGSRLAGPHKSIIPAKRAEQIEREGRQILRRLQSLHKAISGHIKAKGNIRVLLEKTLSEYDTDRNPWMKYFRRSFRLLKPKKYGSEIRPSLGKPSSWSPRDLTVLILHEKYLREKGAEYPPSTINRILKRTR